MEETSNKNIPSPDLFDLDAGGWGYAWTSPLSGHWLLVFSRSRMAYTYRHTLEMS